MVTAFPAILIISAKELIGGPWHRCIKTVLMAHRQRVQKATSHHHQPTELAGSPILALDIHNQGLLTTPKRPAYRR
jgi:hypothetical protein